MTADKPGHAIRIAIVLLAITLTAGLLWRSYRKQAPLPANRPSPVIVEVKGDVPLPGIHLLEHGRATVLDALSAAGRTGNLPRSERALQSGESVRVVNRGTGVRVEVGRMAAAARLACGLKIDINSASEKDLLLVPQMRPHIASAIVTRRERKAWKNVEELREIHGIGFKTVQRLNGFLEVLPPGQAWKDSTENEPGPG